MSRIVTVMFFLWGFHTIALAENPRREIFVWRYWHSDGKTEKEKMALINHESTEVSLVCYSADWMGEVDTQLGLVGGPWKVLGNNYVIVDAPPHRFDESDGRFLYIYFDSLQKNPFLEMSYSSPKPDTILARDIIYTTEAINGHGWSSSASWWEQESIFLLSGEQSNVRLRLPWANQNPIYILILEPRRVPKLQPLIRRSVDKGALPTDSIRVGEKPFYFTYDTFPFETTSGIYITVPSGTTSRHRVQITLMAPAITNPTLMWSSVNYFESTTDGGLFSPQFLVLPRDQ